VPQVNAPITSGVRIAQNLAAAATVTVTLPTPPAGSSTRILWIACYASSATAADVHVTKADATSILRYGGAGIGALGLAVFGTINDAQSGIPGYDADGTLVVFTTTAGTNTECTVGYTFR